MHPSKFHPTTAAPSSALKLGFTDIDYTKDPAERAAGLYQSTPSKMRMPSSDFTFRVARPSIARPSVNDGLSTEAKQMMDELRDQAARIKVELAAQREQEKLEEAAANDGRRIRQAKGKAGRYSAVHMAEFKKMDSIANHPSAFRAAPGRFTPVKQGLKRTQSKANLGEPESVQSKKHSTRPAPSSPREQSESPIKRLKQKLEDDVSALRPVSRDASFIPRPKSSGNDSLHTAAPRTQTFSRLMTPTKSSLARTNSAKKPTISLVKTPSKPNLHGPRSPSVAHKAGLAYAMKNKASGIPTQVQTPGRFDRVKSILKLKRQISGSKKPKSNIPQMPASPSKTSLYLDVDKELPQLPQPPLTTPGRKLERHVGFTPTAKQAALSQNSPSPVKSGIPRAKPIPQLQFGNSTIGKSTDSKSPEDEVAYPDLSSYCRDINEKTEKTEKPEKSDKSQLPESVPGTFTFRSDHTIRFDDASPKGFGGASGQASIRHIRESLLPTTRMPGSFPRSSVMSSNKENKDPVTGPGIPHGMSNKKRHRVSWNEEEDDDSNERTAKKLRKNPPAEGHALVAPRLVGADSPTKKHSVAFPPSPQKKKGGISLSRLNMLARPKARK